jgi:hypothetical protein
MGAEVGTEVGVEDDIAVTSIRFKLVVIRHICPGIQ